LVKARLAALANQMGAELCLSVQLVTGPWYLHLLGQCYKGGPRGGIPLMITYERRAAINLFRVSSRAERASSFCSAW